MAKENSNDILYLLNPKAYGSQAVSIWKSAVKKYKALPQSYIDITKVDNLSELLEKNVPKIVAIVGGDGTINNVCSAVVKLKNKPILTVIPMGFGNAIAYCLGAETVEKAIDVLTRRPRTIDVDIMKTNAQKYQVGVFNIGVGYDARIVRSRINYPYIGIISFVLSGAINMVLHPEKEMTFTIDRSVTLKATASSLVIANCPIVGRNYVIAQDARLNDGFLDCTIFSTKFTYITNLRPRGFKHPLYSALGKVRFKAKHIRVLGEPFVQIDGDAFVQHDGLEIEVMPKMVTFLRNKRENINKNFEPFT